ncbi:MAG: sensor histidine kinase [Chitinophagales bacterium]
MRLIVSFIVCLFLVQCSKPVESTSEDEQKINYYNQQFLNYYKINLDTAALYLDSLKTISNDYKNEFGLAISEFDNALLEHVKGNYNISIKHNELALEAFDKLKNDTLIARTNNSLGSNYWQKSDFDKSLQYYLTALKINKKLQLNNEIAICYNYISMLYQTRFQLSLAEEYAQKAYQVVKNEKPNVRYISIYHNLANIYGMQAKYSEAMQMDSIGLTLCNSLQSEFNKSMFYDNLANCYFFSNDIEQSIEFHHKAIAIDSTFKNKKQLSDSYFNLGAVYEAKNDTKQAFQNYNRSLVLSNDAGYKIGIKNAYSALAELYFKTNQPKDAYLFLKKAIAIKDSIINENTEHKIAELQTLYDINEKEQKIVQQKLQISNRNSLIAALLFVFLSSILVYYLLYNRYKFRKEKEHQQELLEEETKRTKAILTSEENERQRLARELHDGVGQMLAATKLNLNNVDHSNFAVQQAVGLLDDSIREIRNISHNMMPEVLVNKGLKIAIENFIEKLNKNQTLTISFESNGFKEQSINTTEKLMLYRILQEAIQNSLKYANATNIDIQLSADEKELTLLVQDNGKGFDISKLNEKDGIGLKNMQLRAAYLKGNIEIDSSSNSGTTIIVEIPLSYKK